MKATQPPTKCLRNGGVTYKFKVLSSFNVLCRGQGAALKAHHCANTNVKRHREKYCPRSRSRQIASPMREVMYFNLLPHVWDNEVLRS